MIVTSSYKEMNEDWFKRVSISADRGKSAGYEGKYYQPLAPKKEFWRKWKDNRGIVPEEENNRFYIEHYFDEVLKNLDPEKVYNELNNTILLCYEDNNEFCHRHIVAAWLELLLEIEVNEVKVEAMDLKITDKPTYIKEELEAYMRKTLNMKGFTSLKALYLFEKGNKYDDIADKLEKEGNETSDSYRQMAAFLRSDADMEEDRYKSKQKIFGKSSN